MISWVIDFIFWIIIYYYDSVIADKNIRKGYEDFIKTAIATHKLDGTCCYIDN